MMRGLFVTGTNTGVGKTVITRALARFAARQGIDVAAVKPVESGVDGDTVTDATRIAKAAVRSKKEENCAYAFREAVSPHLAARLENVTIDPGRILRFLSDWTARAEWVIAEGAGGLLVPLAPGVLYADVMAKSGFALLVVAQNVLGTINSTLLTLEAARHRGMPVAGVVLNGTPDKPLDNAAATADFGGVSVLGEFPTTALEDDDRLADAAAASLNWTTLLEFLKPSP